MSYTTKDFLEGRIILCNPDRNIDLMSKLMKQIYPNDKKSLPTGNSRYYYTENGKWKGTDYYEDTPSNGKIVDIKTLVFSDVIDYKEGDWVVVQSYRQCKEGNGISKNNHIGQLRLASPEGTKDVSGMMYGSEGVKFEVSFGKNWFRIRNSHIIRKAEENEIPTQSCVQKLSVGDTYEFGGVYRIISDFKDGMFHVSNRQGIVTGKFSTHELLECFAKSRNYTNYKSVLLTNNKNNQNEKTGKTSTVDTGKRTESSISSSSTRQIASASRLVGDPTHGKCKKTRVRRIEISSNAISF